MPNSLRYVSNGGHYARRKISGKLIRGSAFANSRIGSHRGGDATWNGRLNSNFEADFEAFSERDLPVASACINPLRSQAPGCADAEAA